MSTVSEVADRATRWLHPGDDQPVIITFSSGVTNSATSWSYADAALAPDEEDLLAPGVIVEAGTEQARITAVDETANTLTVIRGVNGTTAAAHSSGDEITVAPVFGRHELVEAVKDNVVGLYPDLWHVANTTLTTQEAYVEVPATVISLRKFTYLDGTRYYGGTADLLTDFPPSSTTKAVQFYGIPSGKTGYLVYESSFDRPSSAATDLADLGVDPAWERIVVVGAVAQVVGQRPIDALTAEYITEQLEREALPPGASTDIRNGLLTLRSIWVDQAQRGLRAERAKTVVYNVLGA